MDNNTITLNKTQNDWLKANGIMVAPYTYFNFAVGHEDIWDGRLWMRKNGTSLLIDKTAKHPNKRFVFTDSEGRAGIAMTMKEAVKRLAAS